MIDLQGRRALVTGGSRGIGRATALLLARCGADVALTFAHQQSVANDVVQEIAALGGRGLALQADFAKPATIPAIFTELEREWGGLDLLINNAGIWEPTPIAVRDEPRWSRTLQVNLMAVVQCIQAALPLLARSPDARIVNVSSTAGQRGEAGYSAYSSTKSGLIGLTKSLAVELGPQVRINAVAPGWVETDMTIDPLQGPERERIIGSIPLQRLPSPNDIAGPIVFLCSQWANHITGEVLNVNGGSVLCG